MPLLCWLCKERIALTDGSNCCQDCMDFIAIGGMSDATQEPFDDEPGEERLPIWHP